MRIDFLAGGYRLRFFDRFDEETRRFEDDLRSGHTLVGRSEEHTSELQSRLHLVCRLLLEKKKKKKGNKNTKRLQIDKVKRNDNSRSTKERESSGRCKSTAKDSKQNEECTTRIM